MTSTKGIFNFPIQGNYLALPLHANLSEFRERKSRARLELVTITYIIRLQVAESLCLRPFNRE